uniref:Uncharacterized protein n=1 Tax=Oncorhynchus kisutch TaxID=8019 RepID=A0A8C7JX82_ONCKI
YHNQHHKAEQDNNTTTNIKSLIWTCQFPYDRHLSGPLRLTSNSATAGYCKLRVHCRSLAGNVVHVLTVTSPGGGWAERSAKQVVAVTAGVQPGENNSSWLMQGFLDFLLSVGRHQAAEGDLCTLLRDSFPCVWHTRNMVNRTMSSCVAVPTAMMPHNGSMRESSLP